MRLRFLLGHMLALSVVPLIVVACGSDSATSRPQARDTGDGAGAGTGAGASPSGGGAGLGGEGAGAAAAGGETGAGATGAGATGPGGAGGGGGGGPIVVTPGSYALPPPNQCKNQFYVEKCEPGKADSACGGVCTSLNACESGKPPPAGFICPRFMLFAPELEQAVKDDMKTYGWAGEEPPFHYVIGGHDLDSEMDENSKTNCCQCYQLVFEAPEDQVLDQKTRKPTVPIPKPVILQSFNTAAGGAKNFDLFMGGGGFGAFNSCAPAAGMSSNSGAYQYTAYPADGQPSNGGVKAVTVYPECKTAENLVTAATLESAACKAKVESACNQIQHSVDAVTQVTRDSCIRSNQTETLYHLNWKVRVKRVQCPAGLTQVTGCKLSEPSKPLPEPAVQTAEQATAAGYKGGYSTTTMQDCCKPTCAWQDKVSKEGQPAEGKYNSFYTCDAAGTPLTEAQ